MQDDSKGKGAVRKIFAAEQQGFICIFTEGAKAK
jgi:hypothetical protein